MGKVTLEGYFKTNEHLKLNMSSVNGSDDEFSISLNVMGERTPWSLYSLSLFIPEQCFSHCTVVG